MYLYLIHANEQVLAYKVTIENASQTLCVITSTSQVAYCHVQDLTIDLATHNFTTVNTKKQCLRICSCGQKKRHAFFWERQMFSQGSSSSGIQAKMSNICTCRSQCVHNGLTACCLFLELYGKAIS